MFEKKDFKYYARYCTHVWAQCFGQVEEWLKNQDDILYQTPFFWVESESLVWVRCSIESDRCFQRLDGMISFKWWVITNISGWGMVKSLIREWNRVGILDVYGWTIMSGQDRLVTSILPPLVSALVGWPNAGWKNGVDIGTVLVRLKREGDRGRCAGAAGKRYNFR